MSTCFKCDGELIDVFFLECSAYYCTKKYHFNCVEITAATKDVVINNKNVRWFCDLCLEEPLKPIIVGLDAIYSKMLFLEKQMEKIQQSSSQGQGIIIDDGHRVITEGVPTSQKDNAISDSIVSNKGQVDKNKRKSALFTEISLRSSSAAIESVVSGSVSDVPSKSKKRRFRKKSLNTKIPGEDVAIDAANKVPGRKSVVGSGGSTGIEAVRPAEAIKYIHVSRVKSSVTCQLLSDHLAANLEIEAERLKCFRISRKLSSGLEIVSFKVGVPSVLFDSVFRPEIWSDGLVVREFIHRPRKTVPKNSNHPPSRSVK